MIGIFDSGSGGLTVLRAIRDVLPSADVVYFGDIKNVPYGTKSPDELAELTVRALQLLHDRGARVIVSACNSVSASLAISLFEALSISPNSLIEMVGPTVRFFKDSPARLLLCATPATVRSAIYHNGFHMVGKEVTEIAIPELASAIEFGASETELERIVADAFRGVPLKEYDALILGCTHYPLALSAFRNVIGDSLTIVDPARIVAERVEKEWWPREAGDGTLRFIISRESKQFREYVAHLFPKDACTIEVLE